MVNTYWRARHIKTGEIIWKNFFSRHQDPVKTDGEQDGKQMPLLTVQRKFPGCNPGRDSGRELEVSTLSKRRTQQSFKKKSWEAHHTRLSNCILEYSSGRAREKRDLPSASSLLTWSRVLGLGLMEARSVKLHSDLPRWWQASKTLSHLLRLPQARYQSRLGSGAELGPMWDGSLAV